MSLLTQLQIRRDTAANWSTANPVLAIGELGLETDTGNLRAGDGSSNWNALATAFKGVNPRTSLQLAGTPSTADVAKGPGAMFVGPDNVLRYINAGGTAYVAMDIATMQTAITNAANAAASALSTANSAQGSASSAASAAATALSAANSANSAATAAAAAAASALAAATAAQSAAAAKQNVPLNWDGTTPALVSSTSPVTAFGSNAFLYTGAGGATLDGNVFQTGDMAVWNGTVFTKIVLGGGYLGAFASSAALQTAYPAASNPACTALVAGVPFISNGTAWGGMGSSGPAVTSFGTAWDMTSAAGKDMGEYTVTSATALTSVDTGSVPGGFSEGVLIADGAHIPTFDGATLSNYSNTVGARNRVNLKRIGKTKFWSASTIVGAIMAIAAAPTIAVAPTILVAAVGSPVTFLPAQGATGYPAPTVTYDLFVGSTLQQANVTSGSYTMPSITGTLFVKANAVNASGSITVSSSGATIQQKIDTPSIVLAGDSIPQFSHPTQATTNAWTIARDTAGLVTLTKTSHGLVGDGKVFVSGMTDTTFNGMWDGHFHDSSTYYIQTNVTGSVVSASTTICAAGQITQISQLQTRGVAFHLLNLSGGGIKYGGAYAQGAMFARDMAAHVTKAAAAAGMGVVLIAGTNDNKGAQTTAQTIASIKALIDIITAAGKKVWWCHITPLGTTFVSGAGYATYNSQAQTINTAIDAYVDNVNSFTVASFAALYNSGTSAAFDYATFDSIHWTPWATQAVATLLWAKINPLVTVHNLLPTSSGGATGVSFATKLRDRAIWTTPTTAATPNTGGSHMVGLGTFASSAALQTAFPAASNSGGYALVGAGPYALYHSDGTSWTTNNAYTGNDSVVYGSIPTGWGAGRASGTGTVVAGVVADATGGSNGLGVKGIFFGGAAADTVSIWPDTSSGASLSVAGNWIGGVVPPAGTRFKLSCVISWAGHDANLAANIRLFVPSQTSGLYLTGVGGDDFNQALTLAAGYMGDSGSMHYETGVMVMPSIDTAPTGLFPAVQVRFAAASTTPLQVTVQNVQYFAITDAAVV